MSMKYDEAVKVWGLKKLMEQYSSIDIENFVKESVTVEMEMNEGYSCCGGSDPDCYCSLAESPSMEVKITAEVVGWPKYRKAQRTIPSYAFDFVTVLKEIVEAGDGEISA